MSPTNNPFSVTRGASKKQLPVTALFEAEPMIHPNVLDAYEQAVKVLNDHHIPFRATGGIALNLFHVGRPTKAVDLIVSRQQWHQARQALQSIATDVQGIILASPTNRKMVWLSSARTVFRSNFGRKERRINKSR